MGMFDYLSCKMPLPPGGPADANEREYQTKHFDCELDRYEISADGTLWRRRSDWIREVDTTLAAEPNEDGVRLLPPERSDYLGRIRFYDYIKTGNWLEYEADVVDGKVREIRLVHYTP